MVLFVKNMVCHRCKLAVEEKLRAVALTPVGVELGEVTIAEMAVSTEQLEQLSKELQAVGFELLDDKRQRLIEQIKSLVIEQVHYREEPPKEKFSHLISQALHHDYSYLSNLFSEVEGITIEQFVLNQKIERVKELLVYNEKSLSEIADDMGYSSTAHLSNQFKKLTGLTPTAFKRLRVKSRRELDKLSPPKMM